MKRIICAIFCVLLTASAFTEATVVLKDLRGKVEVKPLGKTWMPATEGMKVAMLATISTGFDSSVTLVLDKNQVRLEPLTRLTVDKIMEKAGTVSTNLNLRVGNVSASVKSSAGVSQTFQVTTPKSTASVRGTAFDFDGLVLVVKEGVVQIVVGRPKREILFVPGTAAYAEFIALLQAEFPGDTFEVLDDAGLVLSPESGTVGNPPDPILVGAGQSIELVIDYSVPGGSGTLGDILGATNAPSGSSGIGGSGNPGSSANSPTEPVKGRITIKWSTL